jgi:hypothetical protein
VRLREDDPFAVADGKVIQITPTGNDYWSTETLRDVK